MTTFNGMILNEAERIGVDEPLEGLGRKLVVDYESPALAATGLQKFRSAWEAIGRLGRWCDDDLGDWPPNETCIAMLPEWLRKVVEALPDFEVDNWLSDLHDRNWVIWAASQNAERVNVHLACESMPISDWPIRFVLQSTGGTCLEDAS